MIIYVTCNPYLKKPFPKIQIDYGNEIKKNLSANSTFARVEKYPLSDILNPKGDWKGFFQTAHSAFGVDNLELVFNGSWEEYQILLQSYDSYVSVNKNPLAVEFVVDAELAKNISPEFRKKFLVDQLKDIKYFLDQINECYLLNDVIINCLDCLQRTASSDAQNILECKLTLDKYFDEFLEKDIQKNDLIITNMNIERYENYEKGLTKLSLHDSMRRCYDLIQFCLFLKNTVIETELGKISQEIFPALDDYLAKRKFNNFLGHWIQERDALIFMETFRLRVQSCCDNFNIIISNFGDKIWNYLEEKNLRHRRSENPADLYLENWLNLLFGETFKFSTADVTPIKIKEIHRVPDYFGSNAEREIERTYIEVVKYESAIVNETVNQIIENFKLWKEDKFKLLEKWQENLKKYQELIEDIIKIEKFREYVEDLNSRTKNLTSIDNLL